jgi:peptide deformylase
MPLAIAQLGQPVLRRVADMVPQEMIGSPPFQDLLGAMRATMEETGGVGLAAPQVFVSLRLFLAITRVPDPEGEPRAIDVFINPTLTFPTTENESAWEGCLSFPELMVFVPRRTRVHIEYYDQNGERHSRELEGFPARVVQHEADHLDGILTLDRAASTRDIIKASEIDTARSASSEPGA